MAPDPETVVELDSNDGHSEPLGSHRRHLDKQQSAFNRRPNQFISLDYEELVAFIYMTIICKEPSPWRDDWKRLFCKHMPLYTNVRVLEDFRPLNEQYEMLDPTPGKLGIKRPRGADAGDQALQILDNVDSNPALPAAAVEPHLALHEGPPTPLGASSEVPVVEGVPIESGKMELANAFRRGNLDGLLATCGYQRISQEMIDESRRDVGKNGINVHLPDHSDVAVRGYYRNVFTREVKKREAANCFSKSVDEETVFRALLFVYVYKLFVVFQKAKRRPVGPEGSEGRVFMCMFSSIPTADLDMLWPESVPNPTTFDVLMVAVPLFIGLCTSVYKIVELALSLDDFTNYENLVLILTAIVAPFSIALRAYTNAKHKYYTYKVHHEKTLAQHTVTTNGGALNYLLSDAAGQEAKEFVVAYTLLATAAQPMTLEQLRGAADSLLRQAGLAQIDFDAEDALAELDKLGLLLREGDLLTGVAGLQPLHEAVSLGAFQDKVVGKCSFCR